jgi:hypothetical protein
MKFARSLPGNVLPLLYAFSATLAVSAKQRAALVGCVAMHQSMRLETYTRDQDAIALWFRAILEGVIVGSRS